LPANGRRATVALSVETDFAAAASKKLAQMRYRPHIVFRSYWLSMTAQPFSKRFSGADDEKDLDEPESR
jgi:hypothetical protein